VFVPTHLDDHICIDSWIVPRKKATSVFNIGQTRGQAPNKMIELPEWTVSVAPLPLSEPGMGILMQIGLGVIGIQ
jgi:hypothetical protein